MNNNITRFDVLKNFFLRRYRGAHSDPNMSVSKNARLARFSMPMLVEHRGAHDRAVVARDTPKAAVDNTITHATVRICAPIIPRGSFLI